ncbi:MAG: hypothetical protein LKI93_03870 [Bifidobacteriaceae bacterium]|jgi:ClpP class serine protease|nr:hypothetical protein [Bifidobacteriaceae bacterium]MCI1914415.1 hypothetical protein [Bifidobacteriaceae bacterium]MCI1935867.1 hypothetical protein [Bifidobacteriaceae bacterium]
MTTDRKSERKKIIDSVIGEERRKVKEREAFLGGLVDASMDFHEALSRLQKTAAAYQSEYRATQREIAKMLELTAPEVRLVFEKRAAHAVVPADSESSPSDYLPSYSG